MMTEDEKKEIKEAFRIGKGLEFRRKDTDNKWMLAFDIEDFQFDKYEWKIK